MALRPPPPPRRSGVGRPGSFGVVGRIAELKTATRLDATPVPGSGAMDSAKADMRTADFLIENKSTVKESYKTDLQVLARISKQARAANRLPALALQFTDESGKPVQHGAWVAFPEHIAREMMTAYKTRMED